MKVLVVDDNPGNREILEMKLKARGFQPETAPHGRAALEKLRSQGYNLIISDLLMPEMDGYQLLYTVKTDQVLKKIPFVVYTATYTEKKDMDLALAMGASAFLVKPAEDQPFFSKIEEVLQRSAQGKLQAHAPTQRSNDLLLEYTQRVVKKLEDKVQEADAARHQVQQLNATLESRVQAATAELQKSVADLREMNQDLNEFAHTVSHDLRSPLRSIHAFAERLADPEENLSKEEQQQFAQRIVKNASRLERLISDILTYSRLKRTEVTIEPVALEKVVQEAWQAVAEAANTPKVTISTPLPTVLGHSPVLVQILTNLFGNAIKYVEKGRVPEVQVSAHEHEGWVRLKITDNGIGIAPEFLERIFKPFERLHDASAYEGSGIGLAIVRQGIEKLGGRCGVESKEGEGSAFWLELRKA